jgi:hypothetical protein
LRHLSSVPVQLALCLPLLSSVTPF